MAESDSDNRLITVCSACLTAACWQGIFYCDEFRSAGTVRKPVSELRKINRESPHYWADPSAGGAGC